MPTEKKTTLTTIQIFFMVFGTLPVGTIFYPTVINKVSGQSGWLFILLNTIPAILFSWFLVKLKAAYPVDNFDSIAKQLLGKWLGKILTISLIVYMVITCGLGLRILANGVVVYLLFQTPQWVIILSMLLVVIYTVAKGTDTVARINEFLSFIVIFLMFLMAFLLLKRADFQDLLPLVSEKIQPVQAILVGSEPFILLLFFPFLFPYIKTSKSMGKGLIWGILALSFNMVLTCIYSIAMFGTTELEYINYPSIEMTRDFEVPFLERLEIVYMFFWIPIGFLAHVITLYSASIGVKQAFPKANYKFFTVLFAAIAFAISFYPDDLEELRGITNNLHPIYFFYWFLVFPLLYIIHRLKKKVKKT